MWFLNRFEPESAVNNIPLAIRLSGDLDVESLSAAIGDVLERHESLRTVFPDVDGVGYQSIRRPPRLRARSPPRRSRRPTCRRSSSEWWSPGSTSPPISRSGWVCSRSRPPSTCWCSSCTTSLPTDSRWVR
ncbi:hypothetical protein GS545_25550 [Rhodococcus hoagii]|nr:hypothetical protein [Prescottella equi]